MIMGDDKIEAQGRINRDSRCWNHLRPSTTPEFARRGDSNILAGLSIILVLTYGLSSHKYPNARELLKDLSKRSAFLHT